MALLFLLLCGTAVCILGYFGYYFARGYFVYGTEAVIDTEIHFASQLETPAEITKALKRPGREFLLLSHQKEKIAGTLDKLPDDVSLLAEGTLTFWVNDRHIAAKIYTYPNKNILLIGTDITDVTQNYQVMQWLSFLSIAFMVMVIVTSYLISRFVVNNTNRIAQTAREIMETGDLSQRIELTSRWDDLSYMAGVINDLLDRIQLLMRGIRQVSDNIAHDLRTPLTRLHNNLADLQSQNHVLKDDVTRETVDKLVSETEQMQKTFNALLRISRIEAGKQHSAFDQINLKILLDDVIELYAPLIEEKQIELISKLNDAWMVGDKNLLFQAFCNLLDNALKYTPEKGWINLSLSHQGSTLHFLLEDSGPGVSENELDKIFDRFYRAEFSRHTVGSGLGLSLVNAVIELHGGKITAKNGGAGLQVLIQLDEGKLP